MELNGTGFSQTFPFNFHFIPQTIPRIFPYSSHSFPLIFPGSSLTIFFFFIPRIVLIPFSSIRDINELI